MQPFHRTAAGADIRRDPRPADLARLFSGAMDGVLRGLLTESDGLLVWDSGRLTHWCVRTATGAEGIELEITAGGVTHTRRAMPTTPQDALDRDAVRLKNQIAADPRLVRAWGGPPPVRIRTLVCEEGRTRVRPDLALLKDFRS